MQECFFFKGEKRLWVWITQETPSKRHPIINKVLWLPLWFKNKPRTETIKPREAIFQRNINSNGIFLQSEQAHKPKPAFQEELYHSGLVDETEQRFWRRVQKIYCPGFAPGFKRDRLKGVVWRDISSAGKNKRRKEK